MITPAMIRGLKKHLKFLQHNNMMIEGRVITGLGEGRKLGFPTANLDTESDLEGGVYAALVIFRGKKYPAALMIGGDFGTDKKRKVEVHLLDQDRELVGEELEVEVVQKVSDMKKVESPEALLAKVEDDISMIRKICLPAL